MCKALFELFSAAVRSHCLWLVQITPQSHCVEELLVHSHACLSFCVQQYLTAIEKVDLSNNVMGDETMGVEVSTHYITASY